MLRQVSMTKKIAIVISRDCYSDDYYTRVIDSISEWVEVTDDEYDKLHKYKYDLGYEIIEQPSNTKEFIANTLERIRLLITKREAQEAEEKRKRAEAAEKRRLKKLAKDEEEERRLFETLKKKFDQ
jgi:hypothetical protein